MFSLVTGQHNKKIVLKTRVGCCLLVAPVVSRRPWEAGEEHKERRTDGGKVLGQVVVREEEEEEGLELLGVHMP